MIKKIAIIGSCITRDNFNSKFNPNYKMFFDCVLHQNQVSLLSLLSDEVPFSDDEILGDMREYEKWQLRTEHSKEFLSKIKEKNPEYLLIDFYADVYCGVVELGNDNYFTYNPKFLKLPILKNKKVIRAEDDVERYLKIWMQKTDKLFSILNDTIPQCKIVLVKSRFEDEFADASNLNDIRKKRGIRTINKDTLNDIWDKMISYLIDNYQVKVLDMTDKRYYLNEDHLWGKFYVHYTMDFYNDFFNKLQAMTFRDIIEELNNERKCAALMGTSLEKAISEIDSLKNRNIRLEKSVKSYENETLSHNIKRNLLKNKSIRRINDLVKGRS